MNTKQSILFFAFISFIILFGYLFFYSLFTTDKTIKVGVLHSLSGTMATSEKNLVEATLFAIEQINQTGGILGAKIEPIIADGKSDPLVFAQEAERLITQKNVQVIFGCWTSSSRKAVKDVVEKYNNLLFYPLQYEGLEESNNIIYTGSPPSQQIIPGTMWAYNNLGTRFFLVGSDYIFPKAAHAIIKQLVSMLKGEIVGDEYIPLGSTDVSTVIDKIIQTKPTVIINTINSDTNASFIKQLRVNGITPEKIPCMFFSVSEPDFASFNLTGMEGDYATWSYFQSIPTDTNRTFVKHFKKRDENIQLIGDPMETAYCGVHLWAETVKQAHSTAPSVLQNKLKNQKYNAPAGVVYIDNKNNHTWKKTRIGKVTHNRQFSIIWDSKKPVRPEPYPSFNTKDTWQKIVNTYKQ
jgi:urea transport system substrate-binding protein